MQRPVRSFTYKFNEGPLETEEELLGEWGTGNYRRAVQAYTYGLHGVFLKPDQILCPASYRETGRFVTGNDTEFDAERLAAGDIIYAEALRNAKSEVVDKSPPAFASEDEYLVALHTALFTGERVSEIWHATAVEGGSCYWSLAKFVAFYKPVAAKRL